MTPSIVTPGAGAPPSTRVVRRAALRRDRVPALPARLRLRRLGAPALDQPQGLIAVGDVARRRPRHAARPPQRPDVVAPVDRARPAPEPHRATVAAQRLLGDGRLDAAQVAVGGAPEDRVEVVAWHQVGVAERADERGTL